MYPTGHYGVALLAAAPVASFLGRRSGTVFSMFVILVAVLPDLDRHLPYVTHHGVTHTFLFAAVAGVVIGALGAAVYRAYLAVSAASRWPNLSPERVFVWATAGVFIGVSGHVVADILVLLPGTQPVSPFWPVFERKLTVEVIPLGAPVRNVSLLVLGFVAQTAVYRYE
ncbi:metal-dependent hydrolase [Halorussus limi]|uniref:Metal-dependent hydrolase n=1 Tax=Halorussus limi TaxID=2938695 RepID=A0A8U0HXZ7_9EURY|nr:metal-dependent hydrolase [Halorussus limi]UPV75798.1 metal-dependent hydrolase [Halorussus limi]